MSIFILTFSLSQLYPKTTFSIIKIVVHVIKKQQTFIFLLLIKTKISLKKNTVHNFQTLPQ